MSNTSSKTRYMVELAMMIAVILLMAFTPLGYIRTPFLTVTLITIPVAVGAMFLGPKGGMVCGLAFGLTSFYTALTAPSLMMAAFMTVNPIYVAILWHYPPCTGGTFLRADFQGSAEGFEESGYVLYRRYQLPGDQYDPVYGYSGSAVL